ncbi:MAG TPA: hypothetical protein VN030_10110 [Cellvibrio sp.]|nr:hypothetical protein [Cellvibrio sp.]
MNRFSLLAVLFITVSAWADISAQEAAADCAKIKVYAAEGDKFYKQKNYKKAREFYESQVGWSETCRLESEKMATAYNNVALTYIHEGAYLKAKAWLQIMPDDKKSIFNLGLIKDKLPAASLAAAASPSGEYWSYAGKSLWDTITINKENTKYAITFAGYYAGINALYFGPNMGEFSTLLSIENGHADYMMAEDDSHLDCVYHFSFARDSLALTRVSGDSCGFGQNVSAEGNYIKVR